MSSLYLYLPSAAGEEYSDQQMFLYKSGSPTLAYGLVIQDGGQLQKFYLGPGQHWPCVNSLGEMNFLVSNVPSGDFVTYKLL